MPISIHAARRRVAFAVLLIVLAFPLRTARAQSVSYVGGFRYAAGDFVFTPRTWSAYFSNGVAWTQGRVRASATIPIIWQPSGWERFGGSGMMSGGMHGGSTMGSASMPFGNVGIGDPVGRVDVALFQGGSRIVRLGVVGAVKAPLAGTSHGFGTGEWDAGAGVSAGGHFERATFIADAVYWRLGNPPGASFRNALAYSLALGRPLAHSRWSVLGTFAGATRFWVGLPPPIQAGVGLGYLRPSGASMFVTVAAGLTQTAPALSTALGWRLPLGSARQ